jgi:Zn-dependent protease with chaperone function
MTYVLYGASLAFAWFVCVNLLASAAVALTAERAVRATRRMAPATRAWILLALRLAPSASALVFTGAVFVPSFARYEPRNFDEGFGMIVTSLAAMACLAGAAAAYRGLWAIADVGRRVRACLRHATPVAVESMQAFRVDSASAAMTLVGVVRPRLLVTGPLLDLLGPEELRAAFAHERGHERSHDNFKRLAMRSAPDVLAGSKASRLLEGEWSLAAEHAADDHAARERGEGLALASALLKIARFGVNPTALPLGSPLVGGDHLRARIERLVHPPACRPPSAAACAAGWTLAALLCAVAAAEYSSALTGIHAVTEVIVHSLP